MNIVLALFLAVAWTAGVTLFVLGLAWVHEQTFGRLDK